MNPTRFQKENKYNNFKKGEVCLKPKLTSRHHNDQIHTHWANIKDGAGAPLSRNKTGKGKKGKSTILFTRPGK